MKKVYSLRSTVMHDGYIPQSKLKDANLVVQAGVVEISKIISKVIERGKLPKNWSEFELSGGR
jgi:hypothetical protein